MKAPQTNRPDPNKSIEAGSGVLVIWPPETGSNPTEVESANRLSKVQPLAGALLHCSWLRIRSNTAEEPEKALVNAPSPVAIILLRVPLKWGFLDPFETVVHVTFPVSWSPSLPEYSKVEVSPFMLIGKTVWLSDERDAVIEVASM